MCKLKLCKNGAQGQRRGGAPTAFSTNSLATATWHDASLGRNSRSAAAPPPCATTPSFALQTMQVVQISLTTFRTHLHGLRSLVLPEGSQRTYFSNYETMIKWVKKKVALNITAFKLCRQYYGYDLMPRGDISFPTESSRNICSPQRSC